MDLRKTILQRAFELARSGRCLNVTEIEKHLSYEKFDVPRLEGPALRKQLLTLIKEGRKSSPA
jgi:hypothetical protein